MASAFLGIAVHCRTCALYVVPSNESVRVAVGALTAASKKEKAFASSERDMLELVAGQVAEAELARAHEQIRELATTDLTAH